MSPTTHSRLSNRSRPTGAKHGNRTGWAPSRAPGRKCSGKQALGHFPLLLGSTGDRRDHIEQNPRPAPHFFHADPLIVAVLCASFFLGRRIWIKSVRHDSERTIPLVLGVAAGNVRHHRRSRKVLARYFADRVEQRIVRT